MTLISLCFSFFFKSREKYIATADGARHLSIFVSFSFLFLLVSCATGDSLEGSNLKILDIFAGLAKDGGSAVCNLDLMKEKFGIEVRGLRKTYEDDSIVQFDSSSVSVDLPANDSKIIKSGYRKFRSPTTSFCFLGLGTSEKVFCNMNENGIRNLMGASPVYSGDTIHAPGRPILYVFPGKPHGRVEISVGSTALRCGSQVSIKYEGVWK